MLASLAAGSGVPLYAIQAQVELTRRTKYLVLLELKGGNDSLNTVVPLRDPLYKKLRPNLAISADLALSLDDEQGLHPSLTTVKTLFDQGHVAILQNVGYEQPNFSHFSSIDIWESASQRGGSGGWVHQLFTENPSSAGLVDSIVFGGSPGFFRGDNANFLVMKSTDEFIQGSKELKFDKELLTKSNPVIAHLNNNKQTILRTANVLQQTLDRANPIKTSFPETKIGKQLENAAKVINAGFDTPVIKISLRGFDTHVGQADVHSILLKELDDALNAFNRTLEQRNLWRDVLLMSYSEFGRRAKENGNVGTDHGAAGCNFVIGPQCQGGLYGEPPRLDQLQRDSLVHQFDFRQLYSTLENQWFDAERKVVDRRAYPPIDYLKS